MLITKSVICLFLSFSVYTSRTDSHSTISIDEIEKYRLRVKNMFYHAYNGYLEYAYPYDELRPITCDGHDTWGSYSLTLVDALDTLAVMGNDTEFRRVAQILIDSLNFNRDINVSVFETNIRVVGGLLSAHLMSHRMGMQLEPGWPCSGPLLRLAENAARRLLPAFNTSTGMPYGTVNLRHGVPKGETPITCTAGVGTFIVEFGALTRLTGDPVFEETALKAMKALWQSRSSIGLVGNHIDVMTGKWAALDAGIGAGVDSYFEYLVKGSIMFQYSDFREMFNEYEQAVEKYLKREDWFMWGHMTKGTITLPIFQSLEAFWPGMQSLIGNLDKAMKTLHNYHQVWKQYGFTPEFYNIPKGEAQNNRDGYPLRPELIESVMYLYRATKDPYLLEVGVDIVESIEHSCRTRCGYATVKNVKDHKLENRMESFFLAETTKYLYLLFDPENFIHNTGDHGTVINTTNGECVIDTGGYVFNTEAHPIDLATLYCCSAEKKKHDKILQDFHDSVDLLALLDIVETEDDMFSMDNLLKPSQKSINPPKKKPFEPNLDALAVDVPLPASTMTVNIQPSFTLVTATDKTLSETVAQMMQSDQAKMPENSVSVLLKLDGKGEVDAENTLKKASQNVEQKLEEMVKMSSGSNIDLTVDKILTSLREISGNLFKTAKVVGEEKTQVNMKGKENIVQNPLQGILKLNLASGLNFAPGKNSSEEQGDSATCKPEDQLFEEQKELIERQNEIRYDLERRSYIQRLFTCPAQPFHSRLSLMGEMFIEN